jgi:hypothetical protein
MKVVKVTSLRNIILKGHEASKIVDVVYQLSLRCVLSEGDGGDQEDDEEVFYGLSL